MTHSYCGDGPFRGGYHHVWHGHGCAGHHGGCIGPRHFQEHNCHEPWDRWYCPYYAANNPGASSGVPPADGYRDPIAEEPLGTAPAGAATTGDDDNARLDRLAGLVDHLVAHVTALETKLDEREESKKN